MPHPERRMRRPHGLSGGVDAPVASGPGSQAPEPLASRQGDWGAARPEAPEIRDRLATTVDTRATAVGRAQPFLVQPAISPSFKANRMTDGELTLSYARGAIFSGDQGSALDSECRISVIQNTEFQWGERAHRNPKLWFLYDGESSKRAEERR